MPCSPLLEMRNDRQHAVPGRFQIDSDHLVKILLGKLHDASPNPLAGIANPDIDLTEPLERGGLEILNIRPASDIADYGDGLAAGLLGHAAKFRFPSRGQDEFMTLGSKHMR